MEAVELVESAQPHPGRARAELDAPLHRFDDEPTPGDPLHPGALYCGAGMRVPGFGNEIFVARHRGRFILHAPLLDLSCEVNRELADAARRVALLGGRPRGLEAELERHGLLNTPPPPPRIELDERPGELTLAVTSRCNLRCGYCYANGGDGRDSLPIEIARIALRETAANAAASGRPTLRLHLHGGGEPTIEWDLMLRVIEEAEDQALRQGLGLDLTAGLNGVMSARRAADAAAIFDRVTVSLDGGPEIHDRQRPRRNGRGSWRRVVETLTIFDRVGLRYGVRMTVTAGSVDALPDSIAVVCETCRATAIQVEPAVPLGRGAGADVVPARAFVRAFRRARRVAHEHGRELGTSGARFPLLTGVFCKAVTGALCVKPSGRIVACYEAPDAAGDFAVGAVSRHRNRMMLDHGRRRRLLRLAVDNRPRCRSCIARYHCAGDCPMKRSLPGAAERCEANRLLTLDQIVERLDVHGEQAEAGR